MDLATVFSSRPYRDDVIRQTLPFFSVAEANLCKRICDSLECQNAPTFTMVGFDDARFNATTGAMLANSTSPITMMSSFGEVKTTERAAVYSVYLAFLQALLFQIHDLPSSQLVKFGFLNEQERDKEVVRLSEVYQDLVLVPQENIGHYFTEQECMDICRIID